VFFVISGFVIGRLLIAELDSTGALSFRSFYARRFRRILPALALMLVIVVLVSPVLAPIAAGGVTNATAAASALFSANAYLFVHDAGGYFATASTLNPLLHTWSLAVEEQFYLAIPAALFVIWRLTIRRTRLNPITTARILIAAITIASLALCIALSFTSGTLLSRTGLSFAYFAPVTRAWEFCAGLGLVLLPARWAADRAVTRTALGVAGYGGIIASALLLSDATTFPGYVAILPVAATALAIHSAAPTPRLARPMIWLGDNSYGWYLWHWPLIVFAAAYWPRAGAFPLVAAAAISLVPAVLSRQLLEQRLIPRITRVHVRRSTALVTIASITLPFLAIAISKPITTRVHTTAGVEQIDTMAASKQVHEENGCAKKVPLGARTPAACIVNPEGATTIALIGDSNSSQYDIALDAVAQASDARLEKATADGCPMITSADPPGGPDGACAAYLAQTLAELQAHPRDIVIISTSTSEWLWWTRQRGVPTIEDYTDRFSSVLEAIAETGRRTILISELPKPRWTLPSWDPADCSALAAADDFDRCMYPVHRPESTPMFAKALSIETAATATAGAERWDLTEEICPGAMCTAYVDRSPVWSDNDHITLETANRLIPELLELLRSRP
jgi:peptidoglycan/LPS O-acetylase OafA/YrhL